MSTLTDVGIPAWDYRREYELEREEILAAVDEVCRSGRLILGERVRAFEAGFAAYCGVGHGVGVNSGTDALVLTLRALGIRDGDEVITVSNTAIATVSAIVTAGAVPRFVDIDPRTYLMDVDQLDAAVTPRTRCILPVHLFGQCVNMARVNAIAAKYGLQVVEDCAQSTGAEWAGRRAGSMSDAAAFSFYPTKVLGGYGDGGMIVTADRDLADRARRLRAYGTNGQDYADEHGYNSRLDEVHAAILQVKLRRLQAYIARRRMLAQRYGEWLEGTGLQLPMAAQGNLHVYYVYVVRHPARDRVVRELAARGVVVNIHYPWPIHRMGAYVHLGYAEGALPETERAAREVFSLPMYPSMTDAEQHRVCDVLRAVCAAV